MSSKEVQTSKGTLVRLEMSDTALVIRCGKILSFGGITADDKSWIEGMLDTFSLEETVDRIFKRLRLIKTVA